MTREEIIDGLCELGLRMVQPGPGESTLNRAYTENNWFTVENQHQALEYWGRVLNRDEVSRWLEPYPVTGHPQKVGIIMAGNIPLVGLHDLLCVLAAGHLAQIKMSSQDTVLMKWVLNTLESIHPGFAVSAKAAEDLKSCSAVIATGSNSTNNLFSYYFKHIPSILRKNRNSIAVLNGSESLDDLKGLAFDIFSYFGLGCRNVSKVLVPEEYDFKDLFEAMEPWHDIIHHNKYANNYTYHKAIFLMNLTPHLDNGFLLVKEDKNIASPLGCLFFEVYHSDEEVLAWVNRHRDELQVTVGNVNILPDTLPFGTTQNPALNAYADGIDTMAFLSAL